MGIHQLNFEGKDKVEVAVDLLRAFEPTEGYYLAFSGGIDSVVFHHITVISSAKFDAHYNRTGIDPPELVYFIREYYPEVQFERPKITMWQGIIPNGLPMRQHRWCCRALKEPGGIGRVKLTGIRSGESVGRKHRCIYEPHNKDSDTTFLNPIFYWTKKEVWEYALEKNLSYCSLYDEGFTRIGCIMCPSNNAEQTRKQMERWPKIADAYRRAANRSWERQTEGMKRWKVKDEYFDWWIGRRK